MATLNVGAGQAYATLSAAVGASRDGDVIAVQAGTYVNDFATISKDITIVGVGGMANFVATVAPPNGKGILVTQSDVTIQNLSFSGAAVADGNGAGIRYEGGNLVIIDSYFHDNQDGLLANSRSQRHDPHRRFGIRQQRYRRWLYSQPLCQQHRLAGHRRQLLPRRQCRPPDQEPRAIHHHHQFAHL